jgi:hypothetical protein
VRLPKLANWLSEGDLEKYQQKAQQASAAQAKLQKIESEQEELQKNFQQTKKELQQAKALLQINQGFQIELGETQLKLQKTEAQAQSYKKELFEQQKQFNLLQSELTKAKESLTRSQNWTQHIQTPIRVVDIKKTLPKQDFDTLWGFGIITPDPGLISTTGALIVKGWVLGKKSQVEVLRVISQTELILETPVKIRRPKIVEQYPDISTANKCGFEFSLSLAGIPETAELNLEAILQDQSVVPLCIIIVQPQLIESKDT